MGICSTKTSEPLQAEPNFHVTLQPYQKNGQQPSPQPRRDRSGEDLSFEMSEKADPHSETDTNGRVPDDLTAIIPVLSPPINELIASSAGLMTSSSPTAGASFTPAVTGGSFSTNSARAIPYPHLSESELSHRSVLSRSTPVSSPAPTIVDQRSSAAFEHVISLHTEAVSDIALTDVEGETISGSQDKSIVMYNWRTKLSDKWTHHSKSVERVIFSQKLHHCFSGSRDTTIRQWKPRQFKEVQSFRGHTLPVTALLLRDGLLISGSRDYSIRQWSVDRGEQLSLKTVAKNVVTCLKWIGPQERGSSFSSASVVAASSQRDQVSSGSDLVSGGLDAHCFLQGSEDSTASVRVWDSRTMEVVAIFPSSNDKYVCALESDPTDSNKFVTVTSSSFTCGPYNSGGEIHLWDRRQASSNIVLEEKSNAVEPLFTILAHADTINSVVYLPTNNKHNASSSFIATASRDTTLKIWDLSSSESKSTRCTQVLQYRDGKIGPNQPRYQSEITSLAMSLRPMTTSLAAYAGGQNAPPQSSTPTTPPSAHSYVLYSSTGAGMLSCWHWNANNTTGRVELIGQTKPSTGSHGRAMSR